MPNAKETMQMLIGTIQKFFVFFYADKTFMNVF